MAPMRPTNLSRLVLATLILGILPWSQPARALGEPAAAPVSDEPQAAGEADERRDDLVRRLKGQTDGDGVFMRVLRNMERSHRRLAGRLDAGERTQQIQARIIADLDDAIATARRMQSSGRRTGQRLDVRRAGKRQRGADKAEQGKPDRAEGSSGDPRGKSDATERPVGGRLREAGRGWGNLPDRDREAVIQSMHDRFLRKYDELIRRYYEALAETHRDK